MADEYKVDAAEAELSDAEEDVNDPPGRPGSLPQSRVLGRGKARLRHVGIGKEGEFGPPTQLLGIVH